MPLSGPDGNLRSGRVPLRVCQTCTYFVGVMMKKIKLLVSGTMLLVSSVASAQAVKADQGFYVGLEGGAATYDIDIERHHDVRENNDAGMVRLGVGYQFNPNFSVEAGYFRIGDTTLEYRDRFSREFYSGDVKGFDLLATYKFTSGLPGVYVKGGLTLATLTETGSYEINDGYTSSVSHERASQSGAGYLLGLGYEYDVTKSVSLNGGYTRYQSLGGNSKADVNLFSLGLKYRF